ncbi:MAG: amidase [Vicinamibacterales bacterium]
MRSILISAVLGAALVVPQPVPFDLEEATIDQLQAGMAAGRYTARQIAERYLDRIDTIDRSGPTLGSVIETNPDALGIADALDRERREKRARGPLHGIPVLLKDNIDTADRMMTTAGSLALVGQAPDRDAFLVERLRAAGAVILGKTNMSEWANFRSTKSASGWSARGGLVLNPYALDRNACGSSSGTGTAISANLAAAGVGTETDGSIVCPSSATGLVGVKPTLGLVSRSGIVPIAHSQDTAGPMTRTVRDAAILLGAMAGVDARDKETAARRGKTRDDYTTFLDAEGLKGARIGVARKRYFGYSPVTDRLIDTAIADMKELGAVIVDPADVPNAGAYDETELLVLLYEFKAGLNAYLATRRDVPVRTLKDLIAFNERERAREMPFFGQELFTMAEKKGPLTDKAYVNALARNRRLSRRLGIDAVVIKHRLDAIVMPTLNPAWTTDLVNGDHFLGGSSTPAAVAGYPSVTVPAGFAYGLPVGMSFVGRAWSEPTLLKLAYAYEQATRHRRPPRFHPTADLSSSTKLEARSLKSGTN